MAKSSIINKTRGTILHENPRYLTTAAQHAKGLMFTRPFRRADDPALAFIFLPPRSVRFHMWFVFGPIDIIALDGKGTVLALRERFAPWTQWNPKVSAVCVLELPPGTIASTKTKVGDTVVLSRQLVSR